MLRVRALLFCGLWQPPSMKDLPAIPMPQVQKRVQRRPTRPVSLAAREQMEGQSNDKKFHVVDDKWFGQRVDDFLMQHHPEWTYGAIRKLVEQGHIYRFRRNGKKRFTRLTDRLEFNEMVVVPTASHWEKMIAPSGVVEEVAGEPESPKMHLSTKVRQMAHEMVLFKNEHVIVINKPSGIPMTPTKSGEVNISDMLPAWKYTNASKPIICHNLDRETSGCVVLARSKNSHRMLGRMFVKRVVPNSVYWGFCIGRPAVNFGRVRMHLETKRGEGGDMVVARPTPTKDTKVAIAEFVVNAGALEFGSFVSLYPLTTRRHQERIMAAHALRCPMFGDAKFGGESSFPQSLSVFWDPDDKGIPLHLHHRKIQLPYKNARGEFICVTAPVPDHMEKTFKKLGWPTDVDDPLIPG